MSTRFDLTDKEWALIEPLLPQGLRGARRIDDRKILNGIFYILRTGSPWRDLPERYGPYTTCYNRYNRWTKRGIFKGIFDKLARQSKDILDQKELPSSALTRCSDYVGIEDVFVAVKASITNPAARRQILNIGSGAATTGYEAWQTMLSVATLKGLDTSFARRRAESDEVTPSPGKILAIEESKRLID